MPQYQEYAYNIGEFIPHENSLWCTENVNYYFNEEYNSFSGQNLPLDSYETYLGGNIGSGWNKFYTYMGPFDFSIKGLDLSFENSKYILVNFCKMIDNEGKNYHLIQKPKPYNQNNQTEAREHLEYLKNTLECYYYTCAYSTVIYKYLIDKQFFDFNTNGIDKHRQDLFLSGHRLPTPFTDYIYGKRTYNNEEFEFEYEVKNDPNPEIDLKDLFRGYPSEYNLENDHINNYPNVIIRIKSPRTFYKLLKFDYDGEEYTKTASFYNDCYLIRIAKGTPPPKEKKFAINNNYFFFPNFPRYSDKLPKVEKIDAFKLYKDLFMNFENPYMLKKYDYLNDKEWDISHVVHGYYNEKLPKYILDRTNRNINETDWDFLKIENSMYQLNNYFYPNIRLNYKYKTFEEYNISAPFFDKEIHEMLINQNYDTSGFFTETNELYCDLVENIEFDGFYEIVKNYQRNKSKLIQLLPKKYPNMSWPILVWHDENFMPPQFYPEKENYEDYAVKYNDYFDNFKDVYLTTAIPYHFVNLFDDDKLIIPRNLEPSFKKNDPGQPPPTQPQSAKGLIHFLNNYPIIFNYTNNPINVINLHLKNTSGIGINDIVSNGVLFNDNDYITVEEIEKYSSEIEIYKHYEMDSGRIKEYNESYSIDYPIPTAEGHVFNFVANTLINKLFEGNDIGLEEYINQLKYDYLPWSVNHSTKILFYNEFLYQKEGHQEYFGLTRKLPVIEKNKMELRTLDFINNRIRGSIFNILLKKEMFIYSLNVYQYSGLYVPNNVNGQFLTKKLKTTTLFKKSYEMSEFYNTPYCRNIKYNYSTFESEIILEPRHGLFLTTNTAQDFNEYDDVISPFPSFQIYFDLIVPYRKAIRTGFERSFSEIDDTDKIDFNDIKEDYTYMDDDTTVYKD